MARLLEESSDHSSESWDAFVLKPNFFKLPVQVFAAVKRCTARGNRCDGGII